MPLYQEDYPKRLDIQSVRELVPSKWRIILSFLLDIFLLTGTVFFILFLNLSFEEELPVTRIYVSLGVCYFSYLIFYLVFKRSIGMAVFGIIYIDAIEGMKINSSGLWRLHIEGFLAGLKYSDLFSFFYFFTNQDNQTKSMTKADIYFAKYWKYRQFVRNNTMPYNRIEKSTEIRYTGDTNQHRESGN